MSLASFGPGPSFVSAGILINGHSDITIKGPGTITGFGTNIEIINSDQVTLKDLTITAGEWRGVRITSSSDITIKDNTMTGNAVSGPANGLVRLEALIIENSHHNIIKDNVISNNNGGGISFRNVDDSTVKDNDVSNNGNSGVTRGSLGGMSMIVGSDNNVIRDNTFNGNFRSGLAVCAGSGSPFPAGPNPACSDTGDPKPTNNMIKDNEAFGNLNGIDLRDRTYLPSAGAGTAGTTNTYKNNDCGVSDPVGLC